jgi:hypothetical protein
LNLPANAAKVSHLKHRSSEVSESFMAIKNCPKNSAETIYALAIREADFKNCCLRSGKFDGSLRHHYF